MKLWLLRPALVRALIVFLSSSGAATVADYSFCTFCGKRSLLAAFIVCAVAGAVSYVMFWMCHKHFYRQIRLLRLHQLTRQFINISVAHSLQIIQSVTEKYEVMSPEDVATVKKHVRLIANQTKYDPISSSERAASATSCLLYTSPSPRDLSTSRMPSSA